MNKNIIFLDNNKFIYKNNSLELSDIDKIVKQKHRIIVILNENIYIRQIYVKSKKDIENKLEEVLEEFKESDDYLFHHEYIKIQKILKIYAIRGGINTNKLCKKATSIEVMPFQMFINNKISRIIKLKSYNCIYCYHNSFYFVSIKNKQIDKAFVDTNINTFREKINKINNKYIFYIDNRINGMDLRINNKLIDLSGVLK